MRLSNAAHNASHTPLAGGRVVGVRAGRVKAVAKKSMCSEAELEELPEPKRQRRAPHTIEPAPPPTATTPVAGYAGHSA